MLMIHSLIKKLLILGISISVAASVLAADFNTVEALAQQGDRDAQYALTELYYDRYGDHSDYKKAYEWYEKAAMQGHTEAQFTLGLMYYNGKGTVKDDAKAAKWFKAADAQGEAQAKAMLGKVYVSSGGVYGDKDSAMEWLKRGCENGALDHCQLYELLGKQE